MELKQAMPALPVQEIAAAVDFYERRLGFMAFHRDAGFARLRRGDVELTLWAANDDRWRRRLRAALEAPGQVDPDTARMVVSGAESFLAGTGSCRVEVAGIDDLYAEYRAAGVLHSPDTVVERRPWGERDFTALDLHRNALTFYERTD